MRQHLSLNKIIKSLSLFLAVSCAYFLFGLLGHLFSIPPSKIGPIWPPSGVALVSMLMLGYRIWPAILIGNIATTLWIYGYDSEQQLLHLWLGLSACSGTAFACYLLQKFIGFPNNLQDDKNILLFMLLGGPISSLITPSMGVSAQYLLNLISVDEVLENWLTWWVADWIGVMIFAPLMLSIFAPPESLWHKRRFSVVIPVLTTFIFVSSVFFYVRHIDKIRNKQSFNDRSTNAALAIKHRLQSHLNNLHAIQNLYTSSSAVKQREFRSFTRHSLNNFIEIQSIELFALDQTNNKFIFTPVYFESIKSLQQEPITNQIVTTFLKNTHTYQKPLLTVDKKKQIGHFLLPIFTLNLDQRLQLSNLIVLNLSLTKLIQQTFGEELNKNLFMEINGTDDKLHNQTIFSNLTNKALSNLSINKIQIANQQWQINFYQDPKQSYNKTHWFIWWLLFSGFIFTILLTIALLLLTGRNFITQEVVNEKTKDLLKAKNIAEQANAAKDQFLATISHELRTPLNGIIGFTQILQKKNYFSQDDKEYIDIIRSCSEQLLTLITDILDISLIGSNKIKFNESQFSMANLLQNLSAVFKLRADSNNLTFFYNYEGVPEFLIGDQKRIQQIFVNLLSNAFKYTDEGSVTLTAQYQDGLLKFSVADTGCGIDESNYNKIFSPFIQLNELNEVKEGVGLGLAITKEIINKMNGNIQVKSRINQGSVFSVSIPLKLGQQKASPTKRMEIQPLSNEKLKVLVADDNEINRLLLINLLNNHHCHIESVENGEKALEKINATDFQLALIDINMPVLNGLELAEALKNRKHKPLLVAVSAYADKEKMSQALAAGFDEYLTKPINNQQLTYLINRLASV